jgi:hypothetical protein
MTSIWDYREKFLYETPLEPGDPLLTDLNEARGSYSRDRLLRDLGLDLKNKMLRIIPSGKLVLFGGHRGCGKSTELREIAAKLDGPGRYFVVQIDALKSLDINNLTYADVALVLAEALVEKVAAAGITVPQVFISRLENWCHEVLKTITSQNSTEGEAKIGAEASIGLPLVGKLFARLTTAIRSNTTYKTEIREKVRNSFTDLAEAFNTLLAKVQEQVAERDQGKTILFIVDGTDRLRGDEADAFFIRDIHQLRMLQANSIYCAPISIINEEGQIPQIYDLPFRLPMVKLHEKGSTERIPLAWARLREFVTRRLPLDNFDSQDTLDVLIGYSGGHPRDLLRLVNLCFQEIDEGPITAAVAQAAVKRFCTEYRRLVQPEDFAVLAEIDQQNKDYTPTTEQTRRMLYDLVLLEYNSFWWQSHPAVRSLDAYKAAQDKLHRAAANPDCPTEPAG